MVKAVEADSIVSERFQFLTFDYSTGDSIPYSAYLLRRAISDLRAQLDPVHLNPAWERTVLIGHSMGGLLCKMMSQDSGSKLWDLITSHPLGKLAGPEKALELLHGSMVFKPVSEVRRLIFIATPHRGSPLAWGPIKATATRLVHLSTPLKQAHASLLASNGREVFTRTFGEGLATSIDELAWDHPLLLTIDGLAIDPNVKRHSIIAVLHDTVRPGGGDGQVPYASAHDPGAVSELIVHAGHYCLEDPRVIEEVARILKEHAITCLLGEGRTGAIVPTKPALAPTVINGISSGSESP
jgi:pimeloyl-ACP methyl ester carboxylesterase